MKRLNLLITDEQSERLKKLKVQTEISVSEHIRRALERYLATFLETKKGDKNG
jgi:predicted CopG family antitoxin